jgi:acetyltransferase-like isoleucine patch superfamily enzyme
LGALGNFFYYFFSTSFAIIPGKIGSYLRVAFYRRFSNKIDWDVNIGFGTFFTKRDPFIGQNASIGAYCLIGLVDIGDNCQLASRISIPSGRYQHRTPSENISDNSSPYNRIIIGAGTWIGEGSVILNHVGKKCTVGAGSVVVHPVEDGNVVAGNPAKPIREFS